MIVPIEPTPLSKKVKIIIISISLVVMLFVGAAVVSAMTGNLDSYPKDAFAIVKKEMIHEAGPVWFFGLGGYDIPVFYFTETRWVPVLQSDYAKYNVGEYFNGPYVMYG